MAPRPKDRRRCQRCVLGHALVVLWLLRWPLVAIASFTLTFLAGLVGGLFVMTRQLSTGDAD